METAPLAGRKQLRIRQFIKSSCDPSDAIRQNSEVITIDDAMTMSLWGSRTARQGNETITSEIRGMRPMTARKVFRESQAEANWQQETQREWKISSETKALFVMTAGCFPQREQKQKRNEGPDEFGAVKWFVTEIVVAAGV